MTEVRIKESDLDSLKNQVVVITGGSSGIGLATVQLLLKLGAKVVVGDINPPPEPEAAHVTFLKTDVASFAEQSALFKRALEVHGVINHVFANAGVAKTTSLLDDELDDDGNLKAPDLITYNVNLIGCMYTTRLGVFYLKKNPKGGSIVVTGSASSYQGFSVVDYCTAKHGVLGLTRSVTAHLPPTLNIRINCLAPDWTDTSLVRGVDFHLLGVPVQNSKAVALSAALCMADGTRKGQVIYSREGRYTELESGYRPWLVKQTGGDTMFEFEEAMGRLLMKGKEAADAEAGAEGGVRVVEDGGI
ncbi:putative oxidoreductase,short chain dehydrogenase [Mytilinidion resinicola]|uniref:Oxidoreductase,short chain dehydrogenase n=1 Tax=Mytilinidion resinicola TaxID=574789 RepID=A0A6A6Z9E7_9PEZI|nr:putative oxidoreductase,short chain dehydrogenase [Mytilinidion resinicola]KAF2816905.1 putative oxidoreductase,short chain dehydrogenase [Mytilinidion resinicola]